MMWLHLTRNTHGNKLSWKQIYSKGRMQHILAIKMFYWNESIATFYPMLDGSGLSLIWQICRTYIDQLGERRLILRSHEIWRYNDHSLFRDAGHISERLEHSTPILGTLVTLAKSDYSKIVNNLCRCMLLRGIWRNIKRNTSEKLIPCATYSNILQNSS